MLSINEFLILPYQLKSKIKFVKNFNFIFCQAIVFNIFILIRQNISQNKSYYELNNPINFLKALAHV